MAKKTDSRAADPRFHRDMLVADALEADPRVKDLLLDFGLPCWRCVVADHETLAQGCVPLGLEVDKVVARLNALPGPECSPTRSKSSGA